MTKPIKNKRAVITSGYGERILNGVKEFHDGIDITVIDYPSNVPIYATMAGKITAIIHDETVSCGRAVFIKPTGKDFYCLYFHMDYISPDILVDDDIAEGEYLGGMGFTGHCVPADRTGMHLHYGQRKGMESGTETYNPDEIRAMYK